MTAVAAAFTLILAAAVALPGASTDSAGARQTLAVSATDVVSTLIKRIESGQTHLVYDEQHGYLTSVLRELDISPSSQTLVFSKTSLQLDGISSRTPRAIYFNDDVYVAWIQGGDLLEISAVDPKLGATFYVLPQREEGLNKLVRVPNQCLQCHQSSMTRGVPGHIMRSVRLQSDGKPDPSAPSFLTTDQSPLRERWGGWYVSGTHGSKQHMGNLGPPADSKDHADTPLRQQSGGNITDLSLLFDVFPYLTPHSDIVALMVLAHQIHVHNEITRAGREVEAILDEEKKLREYAGAVPDMTGMTERRIAASVEPLVQALLFSGEAPLTASVKGSSTFAEDFKTRGPRDKKGRSLRDFDLRRRLMRHPCSYLIYSEAFDSLPPPARDGALRRIAEILLGHDSSPEYAHLTAADRRAIREILTETLPAFAPRIGQKGTIRRSGDGKPVPVVR
jgi:hypothetical protein